MSRLGDALERQWWQPRPGALAWLLWPLSWSLQRLAMLLRWRDRTRARQLPVPVLVVGNLIVGGAGKTPTTIALLQALRERGWRPGLVSRGHGRRETRLRLLGPQASADQVGDEPLLIHRRTGVPGVVGAERTDAARTLLGAHPEVNLLLADDGLQHARLARDWQLIVFDQRGIGNGLTLPAGPLREPWTPGVPVRSSVLYNADQPSTPWPGHLALRRLAGPVPLADWWAGQPPDPGAWQALTAAPSPLAVAGLAEPERFFAMLRQQGLDCRCLPLPDHAPLDPLPWPASEPVVLLTEKDAIKLPSARVPPGQNVWVVALDFQLPRALVDEIDQALHACHPHKPAR
ncbi:tetraacyldisaccharide 4'-kinase [Ideonella sp. 4Y11]|uniref:Tetraacyldisaccharide 4'-kinase n=1 Tax=Ideonella aquatica TaxID=2824119 RepID=A0A941BK18_9BURK|nr:tetraacyldisaccharide 4'-kinase [Ideonella aquatica]MBQ0959458.1 tetraacyldisaccharide 4'-kinase [Ideonella aquatica]